MKNVLTIEHQLTQIPITFCLTDKSYSKYLMKEHNIKDCHIEFGGCCTTLTMDRDNKLHIVIGIKYIENVYSLKAMLVHELNHATTKLMNFSMIEDDEYRSYTLQWLYLEIVPFLDKSLNRISNA